MTLANLPPGVAANDIPDAPDPFDCGICLEDWQEHDQKGFDETFKAVFESEAVETLLELFCDRDRHDHRTSMRSLVDKMKEKLEREVSDGAPWVGRYMAKFDGDGD